MKENVIFTVSKKNYAINISIYFLKFPQWCASKLRDREGAFK